MHLKNAVDSQYELKDNGCFRDAYLLREKEDNCQNGS